ncbi:MAG: molybdenum cofactor guanylyltransferase [Chloroflexota bacterium]
MTSLPAASAIVLAGGRSRRFGRDKLAEPLDGRTLLDHAIAAVSQVATDVLVVAAPGSDPKVQGVVHVVHDEIPDEGPLAGLAAGLALAREPLVVVVGGDMPTLVVPVLAALLRALEASQADAVVLEHRGRRQPLPMAVRNGAAAPRVKRLVDDGERRLSAVLDTMPLRVLAEGEWRSLDPQAETLRDVDLPEDLQLLTRRDDRRT